MQHLYPNGRAFNEAIRKAADLEREEARAIREIAALDEVKFSKDLPQKLRAGQFSEDQLKILSKLEGRSFQHKWEIKAALAELSGTFRYRPSDDDWNNHLDMFYYRLWSMLKR